MSIPLYYSAYQWRVRALVDGVWGTWSSPLQAFDIEIGPQPLAPYDTIADATPEYFWSTIDGAARYQIQLMEGNTILFLTQVPAHICGSANCAYTPSTVLTAESEYKWRVRSKVGDVWGAWRFFQDFTIEGAQPEPDPTVPMLQTPLGETADTTPEYIWETVDSATRYQIQLMEGSTTIFLTQVPNLICESASCAYNPATILNANAHEWRVRALIDGVWHSWSSFQEFTVTP